MPVMSESRLRLDLTVRRLVRRARCGTLATALAEADRDTNVGAEHPYASLVTVGWGIDASPIFLFSALSDHTRNLARDPRAALLIEAASRRANPQTGPRVTLMGRIAPCAEGEDERNARRRFLARHPGAERYAGFGDFRFFRMTVERAHYVGGFARAVWVEGSRIAPTAPSVAAIAACEESVLAHMNADHGEAVDLYARRLLGRREKDWTLAGLDPDGIDLRRGSRFARLDFSEPVGAAGEVREALVALATEARAGRRSRNRRPGPAVSKALKKNKKPRNNKKRK